MADQDISQQQPVDQAPPGLDELVSGNAAPANTPSEAPPPGLDALVGPVKGPSTSSLSNDTLGGATAGALAAANSLTGGVAGMQFKNLYPGAEKDEQALREDHPAANFVGNTLGLGIGMGTGVGEGALLNKIGGVAESVIPGTNFLSKIGSAAVRGAVETGLYQAGEENLKRVIEDPNYSIESAIANIEGAALFGGVLGGGINAAGQSLKSIANSKTSGILKALANKVGGIPSDVSRSPSAEALDTTGIIPSPEVNAALSDNPTAAKMAADLYNSEGKSASAFEEKLNDFKGQINDTLMQSLGKDPGSAIPEVSKYERGKEIGNSLAKEYDAKISQPVKTYNDLANRYSGIDLPQDTSAAETIPNNNPYLPGTTRTTTVPGTTSKIIDQISQLANDQGWTASPSSDIMREVSRVIKELPNQKTLSALDNYSKALSDNTKSTLPFGQQTPLSRAGQLMKSILEDHKSNVIESSLGKDAPETLEMFRQAKQQYSDVAKIKNSVDSALHARGSVAGFGKAVRAMSQTDGESVLNRLSGKGDAATLDLLQKHFPETAELVKQYHIDSLLEAAGKKAVGDEAFSAAQLIKGVRNLSPELQHFALPDGAVDKMAASEALITKLKELPKSFNQSSHSISGLLSKMPGTALGLVTGLLSHNPVVGGVTSLLAKGLGLEGAPDALRLSLLKFLGSDTAVSGEGFGAMANMMHNSIKGDSLISRAASNVFKSGTDVLPSSKIASDEKRKKLGKILDKLRDDTSPIFNMGDGLGHYLPDHGQYLGQTAGRVVNYLNSIRPGTQQMNPLDTKVPPSTADKAAFNSALDIANQPLSVLPKIKDGTLTIQDMKHLSSMYPRLYQELTNKLQHQIIDATSKGQIIPYRTRMSLSLFMAQPLDSTMSPASIVAAQPLPPQQQQQNEIPGNKAKHSMTALNKLPGQYQTSAQARQQEAQTKE